MQREWLELYFSLIRLVMHVLSHSDFVHLSSTEKGVSAFQKRRNIGYSLSNSWKLSFLVSKFFWHWTLSLEDKFSLWNSSMLLHTENEMIKAGVIPSLQSLPKNGNNNWPHFSLSINCIWNIICLIQAWVLLNPAHILQERKSQQF